MPLAASPYTNGSSICYICLRLKFVRSRSQTSAACVGRVEAEGKGGGGGGCGGWVRPRRLGTAVAWREETCVASSLPSLTRRASRRMRKTSAGETRARQAPTVGGAPTVSDRKGKGEAASRAFGKDPHETEIVTVHNRTGAAPRFP